MNTKTKKRENNTGKYPVDPEIKKYKKEVERIILKTSKILGDKIKILDDFYTEIQGLKREKDNKRPEGYNAIYMFIYLEHEDEYRFLKIGQTMANNTVRFTDAHYKFQTGKVTILATSILDDKNFPVEKLNKSNIGQWMRDNLYRIDVLIKSTNDKHKDKIRLNFIEGLLQYKFKPRYEGSKDINCEASLYKVN